MKYQELRDKLKDFVVFSLIDIRKIESSFHRRRLNEWQDKGYIKKLRRGYYMFSDTALNDEALFLIANRLYQPSYVSFESALSYYGLIPEGVYTTTSASSKKTTVFSTPVATFSYRTIQSKLMFAYQLQKYRGQHYKIAEAEKAVLDYIYLNPTIIREADFCEWRFNSAEFLSKADITKFRSYVAVYENKAFSVRAEELIRLIKQST